MDSEKSFCNEELQKKSLSDKILKYIDCLEKHLQFN